MLTKIEKTRLESLNAEIRESIHRGQIEHLVIGRCLHEIRAQKLYRERGSWEAYLANEWGLSHQMGSRWADAYEVAASMTGDDVPSIYFGFLEGFRPAHAKVLEHVPAENRAEVWSEAKKTSDTPTARALEEIADKYKDDLARIDSMSIDEELVTVKAVESEIADAHKKALRRDALDKALRRIRTVYRELPRDDVFISGEYSIQGGIIGLVDVLIAELEKT